MVPALSRLKRLIIKLVSDLQWTRPGRWRGTSRNDSAAISYRGIAHYLTPRTSMSAQPLANRSSPWPHASGADPRRQSGQHWGGRGGADIAKTFLAVMVCGLLLGFGLAYLRQNSRVPALGSTDPKRQTPPLAITAGRTVAEETVPVGQVPAPVVQQPLGEKLAQPAPAVATTKHLGAQPRRHRPQATQRVSRPAAARTRVGTWLRQVREKILPRRRETNGAKRRKQKAAPCKCAFHPLGFSPVTVKA